MWFLTPFYWVKKPYCESPLAVKYFVGYKNQIVIWKTQMPVTGNQIKAARALAGMDQKALADAANIGINTVRNFEGWGSAIVRGRLDTMQAIQDAFRVVGVELLEDGQTSTEGRGVRLRDRHAPATPQRDGEAGIIENNEM